MKRSSVVIPFVFLYSMVLQTPHSWAQEKIQLIQSNQQKVSIQVGDNPKTIPWTLSPGDKADVYNAKLLNGKPSKVSYKSDVDEISFIVEVGKTYDFTIKKGDQLYPQQIVGVRSYAWDEDNFWNSPSAKSAYRANLSNDEKIMGLSTLWSEAKYNFINWDKATTQDWDGSYKEFLPKVLATTSTLDYYRVLMQFFKKLGDGHTGVWMPRELRNETAAKPAIRTRLVEDKVILIEIYDEKLRQQGVRVGQELLMIDGENVRDYAQSKIAPFISESTPQAENSTIYDYELLTGSVQNAVKLTLKDIDGKLIQKTLERMLPEQRNQLIKEPPVFELNWLNGNVAHVKINSMMIDNPAVLAKQFSAIQNASALILDLRENGGGNSAISYGILSFLVDQPFKTSRWFTREYHPSFRPWQRTEKTYGEAARLFTQENIVQVRGKDTKAFDRPIIVLSSARTGSAAEDFLVAFKPLKRGLIIGEPTNGSTGQPLFISLPGGGGARICTKRDTFADGTEFVGIGVIPDVLATQKQSDFIQGQDSILALALSKLAQK